MGLVVSWYDGRAMTSGPTSAASSADRSAIDEDVFCLGCGYNLRGLQDDRCPECGREFDRAALTTSRIPWAYRTEIGAFRAYWRTVWLVTSRTSRFCDELVRPGSYRDAQWFRWVTILHVYLPALLATIGLYVFPPSWSSGSALIDEAYEIVWPVVTLNAALVLVLAAITGLPSYFLQARDLPVERENRAIALSYYASAPLAWTPMMLLLVVGGRLLTSVFPSLLEDPLTLLDLLIATQITVGVLLMPAIPTIWLGGLIGLARRTFRDRPWRAYLLVAVLPVLWFVVAAGILGGVMFTVAYVGLVFASLG